MESVSKEVIQAGKANNPLEIRSEELAEANYVRRKYREQLACHFIPDINVIREKIDKERDPAKIQRYMKKVLALASQFSHIAFELPNSLETYDTNYQTNLQSFLPYPFFQKNFRFLVIIDKYNMSHLFFQSGTFFAQCEVGYYVLVPKQDSRILASLQEKGYSILGERETYLKVGHRFDLTVPFNNSDEIFFLSKHFLYYHIYNLLLSCENGSGVFVPIIEQLLTSLKKMFEGFFEIEGKFKGFRLRNYITNNFQTQQVYDKYIFSQVREFNKIHKSFFYTLQIAKITGKT